MVAVFNKMGAAYRLIRNVWSCIVFVSMVSLVTLTPIVYNSYQILLFRHSHSSNEDLQKCLQQVLFQTEMLRQKHSRLVFKIKNTPGLNNDSTFLLYSVPFDLHLDDQSPAKEYENHRRRMYSSTKELWFYLSHQLAKVLSEKPKPKQIQTILEQVAERKRSLLSEQDKLPALDGHDEWRRQEAASLSDLVQRRLHHLQHPRDCHAAKKVICQHDYCGFGCDFHHLVYCLVVAHAMDRTLVLQNTNWYYNDNLKEWDGTFQPLSQNCTSAYSDKVHLISVKHKNHKVIYLPTFSVLRKMEITEFRPHYIPKDLAQRINRINGDPYSWWVGQIIKYILKLQKPDEINSAIARMYFKSPIVGIHVRRTDKLHVEASSYEVDEYMSHVNDYYEQLELTQDVDKRRVYIATDDVSVIEDAITRFPEYVFYGDPFTAQAASYTQSRYTSKSVAGVLVDLHALSLCDHVVCTFSSNIGRMVYELMQTIRSDAVNRFTSLDHLYFFTGFEMRLRVAVMHSANDAFYIGDLIEYNRWTAITNGTVWRTNETLLIPWHKTVEHPVSFPFPEYKNIVPINTDLLASCKANKK